MPILTRPVREQLEHDRVIRLLQAKYKRKFDVGMNPGMEQAAPVGAGPSAVYPDLVLQSAERARKLLGVVEVETGESVNNLEAMSQWAAFGRLRAPFYLYVPANMVEVARRLCTDMQINVDEIWTYHPVGDQMRFTMVQRNVVPEREAKPPRPAAEPRPGPPEREVRRPSRPVAPPAASRRKAVTAKPARGRAAAGKSAPSRGRAGAAKKKTARPARAQKRK